MATRWATCPECGQTVEVVSAPTLSPTSHPWQVSMPGRSMPTIETHELPLSAPPDIDRRCPGSGSLQVDWKPPPGWRSPWAKQGADSPSHPWPEDEE